MNFVNPLALIALGSVPLLILLYFLKLKRPRITVASTLLWQKVIEDMRVNSPFQRLKRNLLLLLQLLILLALIFALARPLRQGFDTRDASFIVLLDTSASMAAIEEGGKSRFDLARERLNELADNLTRSSEMMIITFNSRAQVASNFLNNRRRLKETIAGLTTTDGPSNIRPALALCKSMVNSRGNPRVLLFSDGAFGDPGKIEFAKPTRIEYEMIGSKRPNLAITALDIRRALKDRRRIEMFVAIHNFSEQTFTGTLDVFLDNEILDSKYFTLEADKNLARIFEADLPRGGIVKVKLDAEDALAADNHAFQVIMPPSSRRVLLVGENNFFLTRAFRSSEGLEIISVSPEGYAERIGDDFGTVIWNAVDAPEVAPANNIYLGCLPAIDGLSAGDLVKAPAVTDWDGGHSICRFLDFSNLLVGKAFQMTLPENAQVFLRSANMPLAATYQHQGRNLCLVSFKSYESNWPLLVSFPIFLQNSLNYFDELDARNASRNITVGAALAMPDSEVQPEVVKPDGSVAPMSRSAAGEYSFAGVDRGGVYRIQRPDEEPIIVAANLFSQQESLLTPVPEPIPERGQLEVVAQKLLTQKELAAYLILAAAIILLLEWVVYHRRFFT